MFLPVLFSEMQFVAQVKLSRQLKAQQHYLEVTQHQLKILGIESDLKLYHSMVSSLIKRQDNWIVISYRHFLVLEIDTKESDSLFQTLQSKINITELQDLPCFTNSTTACTNPIKIDYLQDITRLLERNKNNWRLSNMNHEYQFCPTYPTVFGVPKSISDNTVRHVGKFRSKSRIPVLSYIHSNACSLTRCAQPLVGIKQNSSIQDEKLVEQIFKSLDGTIRGCIIDARPLANAMGQTALGAGVESSEKYFGSKVIFLGVENIHVVRDSYQKLFKGIAY